MSRFLSLLIVSTLSLSSTQEALAHVFPGRPNCPWANPSHGWAQYLSRQYGDAEPLFSIHFTRDIGDLQGGRCYTSSYHGEENWTSTGPNGGARDHSIKTEPRHGGDPAKNQMNVWGAQFTFNEAGELFFVGDGQLAGHLYCHIGSECWQ